MTNDQPALLDAPDAPTDDISRDLEALGDLWREKLHGDPTLIY